MSLVVVSPFIIQVSTGVYERLVFEVASGKQITSSDVINKITWASWTRYAMMSF